MTAQFPDMVSYRDRSFVLAGIDGNGLFDPLAHGLSPKGKCSACWRGFVVEYVVADGQLDLVRLNLSTDENPPLLFGVAPQAKGNDRTILDFAYLDLRRRTQFTGGLLIADDFIRELYVHMGFHPAWKFREVHELIFDDGRLVEAEDRSEAMADVRRKLASAPLRPTYGDGTDDTAHWIDRCFRRDYRRGEE